MIVASGRTIRKRSRPPGVRSRKEEIDRRPMRGARGRGMRGDVAGRRAKVGDLEVYYEAGGEGFPLLMIMGLGGNLDWWDPRLVRALSTRFRTLLFDNRGTGRTDASTQEYTMQLLADDGAGLLDALGIPRAHVLGISMGGMIAQELALNHPEKVERLVLCSTFCGGPHAIPTPPETLAMMARASSAPSPRDMAKLTVPLVFTKEFTQTQGPLVDRWISQVQKAPTSPDTYLRQVRAIARFDAYDRLPNLGAPTLVVHGRHDLLIPFGNAAILAQRVPRAKLVHLERSGHGLAEDMDEMIRSVMEFLGPGDEHLR